MRSSASCGLVSPGSSAARTTSVWPRRGSVMGTTTAEMARMKSTAVSGYSPHGVVSEGVFDLPWALVPVFDFGLGLL